ncbi:MAG: MFS transporter [Firmicutes bacterium]|nr:MFS transporter [Bacillota bacterium]
MQLQTGLKVFSLGSLVFLITTINTMLFPIFPALRSDLNLSLTKVSLLVVFANIPSALLSPLGGVLADRFTRKAIILPSLLLFGTGGLLAGLAALLLKNPFPFLLGSRVIQGIGAAAPMYLAMALAGDIFQSTERAQAVGLMETASGLGKLLAPIIGALAGLISWIAPFFLYPLLSVPVALAIFFLIREPQQERKNSQISLRELKEPLSQRPALIGLATALYTLFTLIGIMFWLSEVLEQRIGGGQLLRGAVISLPVLTFLLTTLLAEDCYRLLKIRLSIFTGLVITAVTIALIPSTRDLFLIWPVIGLMGIGLGIATPAVDTLSTNITSIELRGTITTVFGGVRCAGAAAGPLALSLLMKHGPLATFLPLSITGAVLAVLVLLLLNEREIPGKLE